MKHWFYSVLAILVVVSALQSQMTFEQTARAHLQAFLKLNPEYRMLTQADAGEDGKAQASSDFKSYAIADTNGDGRPDLVVVLINQQNRKYHVACFQGGRSGFSMTPIWIGKESDIALNGVETQTNTIIPLVCINCDANSAFVWTGKDYAFPAPGNLLWVDAQAPIFAEPDDHSKILFQQSERTLVTVAAFGPKRKDGRYWYKVSYESSNGKKVSGFLYEHYEIQVGT